MKTKPLTFKQLRQRLRRLSPEQIRKITEKQLRRLTRKDLIVLFRRVELLQQLGEWS